MDRGEGREDALTLAEDNGKEVGQCVCDSRQAAEDERKSPNLRIQTWLQELDEIERFGFGVGAIGFDSCDDKGDFALVKEAPAFVRIVVGERDEEEVSDGGDEDRDLGARQYWISNGDRRLTMPSIMKIHLHPPRSPNPSICISPKARIPAHADANIPRR